MSENTVNLALRRMGYTNEEMTGHGFRSMASTLLNEQGWNRDAGFAGGFEDCLFRPSAYVGAIDDECFDAVDRAHADTSAAEPISQTPARQRFSSMCSIYSSLK